MPKMVLGKVFACRGVFDIAGDIGFAEREACAFPFGSEPISDREHGATREEAVFSDILNADLGNDWVFSDCAAIDVSGDMCEALVPDMTVAEFPSAIFDHFVAVCPSLFRVPKPEGAVGSCSRIPCAQMWFIPFGERILGRRVAGETGKSVWAIRNDGGRWCPLV